MTKMRIGAALLLAALYGVAAAAETSPLRSFGEIMAALNAGERVRAVFRYKAMKLFVEGQEEAEIPDAVGGMDLLTFEVKMDETFVSAVNDGKNAAGAFFFRN